MRRFGLTFALVASLEGCVDDPTFVLVSDETGVTPGSQGCNPDEVKCCASSCTVNGNKGECK